MTLILLHFPCNATALTHILLKQQHSTPSIFYLIAELNLFQHPQVTFVNHIQLCVMAINEYWIAKKNLHIMNELLLHLTCFSFVNAVRVWETQLIFLFVWLKHYISDKVVHIVDVFRFYFKSSHHHHHQKRLYASQFYYFCYAM